MRKLPNLISYLRSTTESKSFGWRSIWVLIVSFNLLSSSNLNSLYKSFISMLYFSPNVLFWFRFTSILYIWSMSIVEGFSYMSSYNSHVLSIELLLNYIDFFFFLDSDTFCLCCSISYLYWASIASFFLH